MENEADTNGHSRYKQCKQKCNDKKLNGFDKDREII